MLTDAVLVERVIAGFDDAFDELYRRHASSAWRLGQAVAGNPHDAADAVSEAFARVLQAVRTGRLQDGDAFRSYLLTATRNAALDGIRRSGKARPTDDEELSTVDSGAPSPDERVALGADAALIAAAFRNLPERWRSVLWLTEVEGVATKDAAEQLGLSPNGAAQLAVRARAGLRERYLQAHLSETGAADCRFTVDRLGAYVGGGLSARDLAKVDQHLAGCEECARRKAELEDVGTSLRRIALPIPLGLLGIAGARVQEALAASSTSAPATVGARVLEWAKEPTPWMRRLVGASAAGVLGLGVIASTIVGGPGAIATDLAAPTVAPPAREIDFPAAPMLAGTSFDLSSDIRNGMRPRTAVLAPAAGVSETHAAPALAAPAPAARPTSSPGAPAPTGPAATRPEDESPADSVPVEPLQELLGDGEEPLAEVGVGGRYGDDTVAVDVAVSTEPEAELELGPVAVGEPESAPEDDGLQVVVDTPVVEETVTLP